MQFDVYVDGSYSVNNPNVTHGACVLLMEEVPFVAVRYTSSQPEMTKMRNVGGELMAAAGAVTNIGAILDAFNAGDAVINCNVYYDYTGIYEFARDLKPWKPKTVGAMQYVNAMNQLKSKYKNLRLNFIKVKAHSGNKWNEVVDAIAGGVVPPEVSKVYHTVTL